MTKCKICEQEYDTSIYSELCIECYTKEYIARHRERLESLGFKLKNQDELYGKRRMKL